MVRLGLMMCSQKYGKMGDPAKGGHSNGKRPLNLVLKWLQRSPIGKVMGGRQSATDILHCAVAPRIWAAKQPLMRVFLVKEKNYNYDDTSLRLHQ